MSLQVWAIIVVDYTKNDCSVEWYGPYDEENTRRQLKIILQEQGNMQYDDIVDMWSPDEDDDGFGYDDVACRIEAQALPGILKMKPARVR